VTTIMKKSAQIQRGHPPTGRVMDCGGKRSATPLWAGDECAYFKIVLVRAKAVSSLRAATALHDASGKSHVISPFHAPVVSAYVF